ncbi:MAG: thioredoxin domain-containing protein [Candidatus Saccharibacteria bacterium]|nr:thioredoxin domain-containing protein [Candidatus Saccharibacteria bacterium]
MAKKLGLILLFIALGSGAIAYTASRNDEAENNDRAAVETAPEPTTKQEPTAEEAPPVDASIPGSYIEYDEETLANAEGQRVLFFHASWCPQCRSIEAGIESDGVPDGYTIVKVDYDSNQDLRAKYDVRLQTTFVKIDENNEKIDDYVAYNEPTFDAVIRDYL